MCCNIGGAQTVIKSFGRSLSAWNPGNSWGAYIMEVALLSCESRSRYREVPLGAVFCSGKANQLRLRGAVVFSFWPRQWPESCPSVAATGDSRGTWGGRAWVRLRWAGAYQRGKYATCKPSFLGRCVAERRHSSTPTQDILVSHCLRSQSCVCNRPLLPRSCQWCANRSPSPSPVSTSPRPPIPGKSRHSFQHSPRVSHHSSRLCSWITLDPRITPAAYRGRFIYQETTVVFLSQQPPFRGILSPLSAFPTLAGKQRE